jgi:hypothetical protein
MINFKKLLQETLDDNRIEMLMESREYTEDERVYMRGYNAALSDMLEDFNAEYNDFLKNVYKPSLN